MNCQVEDNKKISWWAVTKTTIKVLFLLFVAAMLIWVYICGRYQKGTSAMRSYVFTEEAAALYKEKGSLTVYDYDAYIKKEEGKELTEKFVFIDNIMYTEELSQFQFMLRYNVLSEPTKDCFRMAGEDDPFYFVLKDDRGNYYGEYEYFTDSALMYDYYRVIFTGIDMSSVKELKVNIYCKNGEKVALHKYADSCIVWQSEAPKSVHTLSGGEKKSADSPRELLSYKVDIPYNSRVPELFKFMFKIFLIL